MPSFILAIMESESEIARMFPSIPDTRTADDAANPAHRRRLPSTPLPCGREMDHGRFGEPRGPSEQQGAGGARAIGERDVPRARGMRLSSGRRLSGEQGATAPRL